MKTIRVGINGFGRIGRSFFRLAEERSDIEVVAVNDLGNVENLVYLLKYDTVYGKAAFPVRAEGGAIIANEKRVEFISEKDPAAIPWGKLGVDVVVESTGLFTEYEKAKAHLAGGAKRVVISAPAKGDPAAAGIQGATVLMGVNEQNLEGATISSNASCTTNAASPLISILNESIGIEKALLNTTHAYTASQSLQDAPSKKEFREGRAAAENLVPASTGAAIAVTEAYPVLKGKFDGISIRVPVPVGSIVDVTFLAKQETTAEEVNDILRKAAASDRWKDIFAVTDEPLVSSDIVGDPHASIADLAFTRVVGGNLVKVVAWYDNESGYTHTLVSHVVAAGNGI